MRCKIPDTRLYIGDMQDCDGAGPDWTVIHAARSPCFTNKCGCPEPDSPDYLHKQIGSHLFLNVIAGTQPLYQRKTFEVFLQFAKAEWSTGKPMLIHCNKGNSRAPALAILFLAKVLYRISNESFDDAWMEFETLVGQPFTPHEGIEVYLRENWRELDLEKPSAPPEPVQEVHLPFDIPDDPAMARAIIEANPLIHFAGFTQIESKENVWISPTPNTLQRQIAEAYEFCMSQGIPCRLVIVKPRQVGCSTFCIALARAHARRIRCDVMIMGDVAKRTEKLWQMWKAYDEHDSFPWRSKVSKSNTEIMHISFPDGEKGIVEHETAMDEKAGISGTRQVIIWTEAGRYLKAGGRDKKVVMASMISLPNVANTLGLMESTAEGNAGVFFETVKGAVSLSDRKAFKKNENGALIVGNSFILIFAAWHEFPEYALKRKPDTEQYFDPGLDDRERRGITRYGWTPEQIAWRRSTIKKECGNNVQQMDQDFPESLEVAFLASGRPRFNQSGLNAMEGVALQMHSRAETGVLEQAEKDGPVNFRVCGDGESWLWVSERPQYGCSYIGAVDPCTGEQAEGSPFPDSHGAGIWRASYHEKGKAYPPKLVAVMDVPGGAKWDDEVLASRMKRLLDWYGAPPVVVDVGQGLGVISELRHAGCTLWEREDTDAMYPGKKLKKAGFQITKSTRPLIINEIANYIREYPVDPSSHEAPSIEIFYMPLIRELQDFIVTESGKAEAKSGSHDDLVFMSGLALMHLSVAQMYMPKDRAWYSERETAAQSLAGGMKVSAFS